MWMSKAKQRSSGQCVLRVRVCGVRAQAVGSGNEPRGATRTHHMLHGGFPPHLISGRAGHHALLPAPFWLQVRRVPGVRARRRRGQWRLWGLYGSGWSAGRRRQQQGTLQASQHSAEVFRWKPGLPRPHTPRGPRVPGVGSRVARRVVRHSCSGGCRPHARPRLRRARQRGRRGAAVPPRGSHRSAACAAADLGARAPSAAYHQRARHPARPPPPPAARSRAGWRDRRL